MSETIQAHSDPEPPIELLDAVAYARHDLVMQDEAISIAYEESDAPAAWVVLVGFADSTRAGFEVLPAGPPAELLSSTADGIQQALIDHHREARPACPSHPHPLVATVVDGSAVWACPQGGITWPIGTLQTPTSLSPTADHRTDHV